MATYKVVDADQLDADLTVLADGIRAKTGGTEPLSFPDGMVSGVDAVYEAGKKAERDTYQFAISGPSQLSKDDIVSFIGSLSDTAEGMTATLSAATVNTVFETSEGSADGSASEEWLALIETKPNWTISVA